MTLAWREQGDQATLSGRPALLVLASTYPRWERDHEPGFVHELCKRLAPRFDVTVVTSHTLGAVSEEVMDGVRVVRYRYAPLAQQTLVYNGGLATNLARAPWKAVWLPSFLLCQYLAARKVSRRLRPALIHAHWLLPQGWLAARLARRLGIPFAVTSHGGDLFGLRFRPLVALKRTVASEAATMTVVSRAMQDESRRQGLNPRRMLVLPMGADMEARFTPGTQRLRVPGELLFVGRLVPKKGLSYLLDALPKIFERVPAARLNIAGFGPLELSLKEQVGRLGIGDRVSFLGAVPQQELTALYRRAALTVAPFVQDRSGNQEGLSVVVMEAIACGCPVICGQVAGLADLLGDAVASLCVDPRDTSALAQAVINALDRPEPALASAAAVRARLIERLDWRVVASEYADMLSSCIDKVKGP
jgi:glycosyltransferase involved in cell wall biosynthesis